MKVVILLFGAIAAAAAGEVGSTSVAWPGGKKTSRSLIATVVPAHTKTTAFSTTQYINAVPFSTLSGYEPQFVYQPQLSHFSHFSPFQPTYYPTAGGSFFPDGGTLFADGSFLPPAAAFPPGGTIIPGGGSYYPASIFYPTLPAAPIAPTPERPLADEPTIPSQTPGDADTTVVDSVEFPPDKQQSEPSSDPKPQPPQSEFPPQGSPPPPTEQPQQDNIGASYPQAPQVPSFPGAIYPQAPLSPDQSPSFPQIPQYPQAPQFPQGSYPGFPQFPSQFFPQPSPSPPSSFPSADNSDKSLDDEDTISVDSA